MKIKLIIASLLVVTATIFILQNITVVEVKFFFWSLNISRALLMFVLLLTGIIIGWAAHSIANIKRNNSRKS